MPDGSERRRRYAIIGTGARAEMFAKAIAIDHAATAELVGFADTNPVRTAAHNARLVELGADPVPAYPAAEYLAMLVKEQVDVAVVTTVDRYHDAYIVGAIEAGRNESFVTGRAVRVADLLDLDETTQPSTAKEPTA